MERAIAEDEVREAVERCSGDKTRNQMDSQLLSSNGIETRSKERLWRSLLHLRRPGSFEKSLNASFIAVIPKKEGATNILGCELHVKNLSWSVRGCEYVTLACSGLV